VTPGGDPLPSQYDHHLTTAMALLQNGADPNARDEEGRTPLMYAAVNGWLRVCEVLVSANAKINAVDVDGYAALHLTTQEGRAETCAWLLRKGADAAWQNSFDRTPAGCALINWHARIIAELKLFRGELDAESSHTGADPPVGRGGVLAGNIKKSRRDGKTWFGPRLRVVRR
jgi:ankyrin repeat protein